jgi:hypothetical protein
VPGALASPPVDSGSPGSCAELRLCWVLDTNSPAGSSGLTAAGDTALQGEGPGPWRLVAHTPGDPSDLRQGRVDSVQRWSPWVALREERPMLSFAGAWLCSEMLVYRELCHLTKQPCLLPQN